MPLIYAAALSGFAAKHGYMLHGIFMAEPHTGWVIS